ncbi:MAG: hypothetical protein WB586_28420 [Chthoniobacterales bacterium]
MSSLNNFRPAAGDRFGVLRTNGTRIGLFAQVNHFLNNNPVLKLQQIGVYAPNGIDLVYVETSHPKPPITDVVPEPLPPVGLI